MIIINQLFDNLPLCVIEGYYPLFKKKFDLLDNEFVWSQKETLPGGYKKKEK